MSPDRVAVIGAGTMGAGIAQLAASSGCTVLLFDSRTGAATQAKEAIAARLAKRVVDNNLTGEERDLLLGRLVPATELAEVANCSFVIEAIAESLVAKRELLAQLEALVAPGAILASNTSSLSISALARDLQHRDRVVGMHFFNPVHSMKLVEVVAGLDSATSTVDRVIELAQAWGKVAVVAKSTPGFIVNRIARPFYAEALLLLHERRAPVELIDSALRGAGFKMGPCELMDLIGHDVNFAVTQSMFQAHYADKRFTPSLVQQELVDSGRLGRKSGRGFYLYPATTHGYQATLQHEMEGPPPVVRAVLVRGRGKRAQEFVRRFSATPVQIDRQESGDTAIHFVIEGEPMLSLSETDGRTAAQLGLNQPSGCRGVFDWLMSSEPKVSLAVAFSSSVAARSRKAVLQAFKTADLLALEMADSPGLVVARTLSMLINEAADAVQQGACSVESANLAMRLGVNYPAGPFEWLEEVGTESIVTVLENLGSYYLGERYRVSPWLQERGWHEMSCT